METSHVIKGSILPNTMTQSLTYTPSLNNVQTSFAQGLSTSVGIQSIITTDSILKTSNKNILQQTTSYIIQALSSITPNTSQNGRTKRTFSNSSIIHYSTWPTLTLNTTLSTHWNCTTGNYSAWPTLNTTLNTTFPIRWNCTNGTITTPRMHNSDNKPYTPVEVLLLISFLVIFLLGTLGNGFIYYYFSVKNKIRRTIPEMLFSYLAIVDFTASVINPSLFFYFTLNRYHWFFGKFLCQTMLPLGTIVTTMSGGIFIIIAFDRERSIVFPFKSHFKPKTIKFCVLVTIIYAFLMNFHYALNLTTFEGTCGVQEILKISYWLPTIICFLIQDFTLIFVFAFTNMRIFAHIRGAETALILGALWEKRKRDSAKVIRLLVVLATVYFTLTLPRDVFQISHILSWVFGKGIEITPFVLNFFAFVKVLHTSNSCVNIFIYYRMHKGFRKHLRNHTLCMFRKQDMSAVSSATFDSSPNITRRGISRSRSSSRDISVDLRLVNDAGIGRKRRINSPINNNNRITKPPVTTSPLLADDKHLMVVSRSKLYRTRSSDTRSSDTESVDL